LGILNTGQSEITNLEITILVHEDVARLEVTMYHSSGMDIFQPTKDLVEEVLDELLLQGSRGKKAVEVGAEEFRNEVNVFERRDENIAEADNILVSQVLEQFQLTVCSLGQDGSAEGLHDLLDGNGLASQLVLRRANETEGSHANGL